MKSIVLYATFFGNTQKVAEMVQKALGEGTDIDHVHHLEHIHTYDLIVIGSPTRGFRPTKPVVELLQSMNIDGHQKIAFFDTRIDSTTMKGFVRFMMKTFGYANNAMEKIAKKRGFNVLLPSGEFYVKDSEGPLFEDTEERVQTWVNTVLKQEE